MAGLTGALRLLTGLGWPMIYGTAAFFYRRKHGKPMKEIRLADEHCVEVIGLLAPLLYFVFIWWKSTLTLWDGAVLTVLYVVYLIVLTKMPPQNEEGIEDLDRIPRAIVKSRPLVRNFWIFFLFVAGGALIYLMAEPFLGSLLAVSAMIGIPSFVFVQWVAPFVSEFPEKVSAFYWAKTIDRAPMALMNMVSSNINQWTLLPAMLVVFYSFSRGEPSAIRFDGRQETEILMTLGQGLVGMVFLVNMALSWWEAALLFFLWLVQFIFSPTDLGHIHVGVTYVYWLWFGVELIRMIAGRRPPDAFRLFARSWRRHVSR